MNLKAALQFYEILCKEVPLDERLSELFAEHQSALLRMYSPFAPEDVRHNQLIKLREIRIQIRARLRMLALEGTL